MGRTGSAVSNYEQYKHQHYVEQRGSSLQSRSDVLVVEKPEHEKENNAQLEVHPRGLARQCTRVRARAKIKTLLSSGTKQR